MLKICDDELMEETMLQEESSLNESKVRIMHCIFIIVNGKFIVDEKLQTYYILQY